MASVGQFETLKDGILAYEFLYPTEAGGRKLSLVASRKPERYSSAAPLSADAKQRIVAELVDFSSRATVSVTVSDTQVFLHIAVTKVNSCWSPCARRTWT